MGATSGMGREVAKIYIGRGYKVGVAGRREEELKALKALSPETVEYEVTDITGDDAVDHFMALVERLGGLDIYFHASGVGKQNHKVVTDVELHTVNVDAMGFTRMVTTAFTYFADHGGKGQIAVISSIAGTKGIGVSPSYSASKIFDSTYISALAQLAYMRSLDISFTDIRPGFVRTPLLQDGRLYPMLMEPDWVARKIVKAIDRRKRVKVIDWRYSLLVLVWRLVPRCVWEHMRVSN